MKLETKELISSFFNTHPKLEPIKKEILDSLNTLIMTFKNGNKLIVCGNGGSAADADHIVGELMKGFVKTRSLDENLRLRADQLYGIEGKLLIENLQAGLPAISLGGQTALTTAFLNDCNPEYVYAQQVNALIKPGDCLLAISTSGNAKNVCHAARIAKINNGFVIALSGRGGGLLRELADIAIISPEHQTYKIQEDHLPIYHLLCLALESELFV